MFKRILIANRGEIAVRALRTCREMGISPIAVFSEADVMSLHVRMADQAACIGPPPAGESYLVIDKIIDAARTTRADAIYPGYGFLAENADFAEACTAAGITFIGPPPTAIREMGDKIVSRRRMEQAGVPVVPGCHGGPNGFADAESALAAGREIGFPLLLKASAGGGGKGMRVVHEDAAFPAAFDSARREAVAAFGNGALYIEKLITNPRHVEVQVMVDAAGHGVHYFERDCSVQRRHQKVIEETPCPVLDDATRRKIGEVAVQAARAVGYRSAGTIEFLYDTGTSMFYFLEMNTRLQVEHPITELCCGVDLVRQQIEIADGQALGLTQQQIQPRGAAIECRVYAEDPVHYLPSPGRIDVLRTASGPGVRDDSGVYEGAEISIHYDPLISKLCVWAANRRDAIGRMRRALGEYRIGGIQTNLPVHRKVLQHPRFVRGDYDTGFMDAHRQELAGGDAEVDAVTLAAAALHLQRRTQAQTRNSDAESRGTQPSAWRLGSRWRR